MERDERRLAELGRRAVEMYAVAHIFAELESAYSEAESIKRQDALIREVRAAVPVLGMPWSKGKCTDRCGCHKDVHTHAPALVCLRLQHSCC